MGLSKQLMVVALSALMASCGGSTSPRHNPRASACNVAKQYVEHVITEANSRRTVFGIDEAPFHQSLSGGEWRRLDGKRPVSATPPPKLLVKALEVQGNQSAVARCSSVRLLLTEHQIRYGTSEVDAATKAITKDLFAATIQEISVPVMSIDGKQAVLMSSAVSGPLAGAGFLQLLELQLDGRWQIVALSPLWIA